MSINAKLKQTWQQHPTGCQTALGYIHGLGCLERLGQELLRTHEERM